MPVEIQEDQITKLLVPAERSKRFFTYLIDLFCYYLIVSFMISFMDVEVVLALVQSDEIEDRLVIQIIGLIILTSYYIFFETVFAGKTPGKWVMKTRVVERDGGVPSLDTISKRSLIRIVPFEGFSFLGNNPSGWHDRWSGTIVIDETLSRF